MNFLPYIHNFILNVLQLTEHNSIVQNPRYFLGVVCAWSLFPGPVTCTHIKLKVHIPAIVLIQARLYLVYDP